MKAYVHKNKDGKYCTGKVDKDGKRIFSKNLIEADKYYENEFALEFCPKDCEVVEITIAEGDLEQQLAEKDKEIEELKTSIDYWKNEVFKKMEVKLVGVTKEKIQEIRKQVCDEIFKELQENTDCYFEERECNSPHSQLPYIWFNEIRFRKFLDQIEKGNNNE